MGIYWRSATGPLLTVFGLPNYSVTRFVRDGARLVGVLDGEGTLLHWNLHGAGHAPFGRIELLGDNLIRRQMAEETADSLLVAQVGTLLHDALYAAGLVNKGEAQAIVDQVEAQALALLRAAVEPSVLAAVTEAGLAPNVGGQHFAGLVASDLTKLLLPVLDAAGYADAEKLADHAAAEAASLGALRVQQGIDVALAYEGGSGPIYYAPKYYVTDHLGSVRAVVDSYDGRVVEARDYYPFGLQMPGRVYVEDSETREGYTGHELDQETGLYYAGARYYMPALGRWTAVDPLAAEFPSWSPYNYTFNNPVWLVDPDGRAACEPPDSCGGRALTIGRSARMSLGGGYVAFTAQLAIGLERVQVQAAFDIGGSKTEGEATTIRDGRPRAGAQISAVDVGIGEIMESPSEVTAFVTGFGGVGKYGGQVTAETTFETLGQIVTGEASLTEFVEETNISAGVGPGVGVSISGGARFKGKLLDLPMPEFVRNLLNVED